MSSHKYRKKERKKERKVCVCVSPAGLLTLGKLHWDQWQSERNDSLRGSSTSRNALSLHSRRVHSRTPLEVSLQKS